MPLWMRAHMLDNPRPRETDDMDDNRKIFPDDMDEEADRAGGDGNGNAERRASSLGSSPSGSRVGVSRRVSRGLSLDGASRGPSRGRDSPDTGMSRGGRQRDLPVERSRSNGNDEFSTGLEINQISI